MNAFIKCGRTIFQFFHYSTQHPFVIFAVKCSHRHQYSSIPVDPHTPFFFLSALPLCSLYQAEIWQIEIVWKMIYGNGAVSMAHYTWLSETEGVEASSVPQS